MLYWHSRRNTFYATRNCIGCTEFSRCCLYSSLCEENTEMGQLFPFLCRCSVSVVFDFLFLLVSITSAYFSLVSFFFFYHKPTFPWVGEEDLFQIFSMPSCFLFLSFFWQRKYSFRDHYCRNIFKWHRRTKRFSFCFLEIKYKPFSRKAWII